MRAYNIKSRRREWTAHDTTIKSIRVYSDPEHMWSPDKWKEENYYEFRFDIVQDEGDERPVTVVSYTVFPNDRDTTHRVNEEDYTNPNTALPIMNERYILYPKGHDSDIIVEFFGDYSSVVIYGLPDEAQVGISWVEVSTGDKWRGYLR